MRWSFTEIVSQRAPIWLNIIGMTEEWIMDINLLQCNTILLLVAVA